MRVRRANPARRPGLVCVGQGRKPDWRPHLTGSAVGIFPVQSDVARALGSKPLKPERSLNYSAGFAWSPTDQFNVTVDRYLIDLSDRILLTGFIGGDSVEKILASKNLPITSAQYFTNIIDTRTKGIDLTGNYRTILGSAGVLTWTPGANFTTNRITRERPLPTPLDGLVRTSYYGNSTRPRGCATPATSCSARRRS